MRRWWKIRREEEKAVIYIWYWQHTLMHPKMHYTGTDSSAKVKLNNPPLTACPNYSGYINIEILSDNWTEVIKRNRRPLTAVQTLWLCAHGIDYKTKVNISHKGCGSLVIYTYRLTGIIKQCKQCNCYHPILCAQSCRAFILCDQLEMLTCR